MKHHSITKADCLEVAAALQKIGAVGLDHAVPRKTIAHRLQLRDRVLRAVVSAAPGYGVPIGSSSCGYFVATSKADAERAANECASRAGHLRAREKHLRAIARSFEPVMEMGLLF